MSSNFNKSILSSVAFAALLAGVTQAHAGGFAIREQSAAGQGLSFAGAAAGGAGLGSAFWNPATLTDNAGWQSAWSVTGIIPYAKINPTGGTLGALPGAEIGLNALVPGSTTSYQVNSNLWVGLNVGAPFGLATKSLPMWAGQTFALTSEARSTNITPMIAYKISDMISVAVGVQAMQFSARFTSALAAGVATPPTLILNGKNWGYGFTAGVTIKPAAGTEIGIGYRSQVREQIKGNNTISIALAPVLPAGSYGIQSTIKLPDTLTIGLKQKINDQWTVLAGYEWSGWSVFGTFPITCTAAGAICPPPAALDFRYRNGWFASAGAEYKWNKDLTMRAGLAYEHSPISDAVRGLRLPDNDRIWASIGANYVISEKTTLDVGYTHIFAARSTPVSITSVVNPAFTTAAATLTADVKSRVDIISVGLRYRFDQPTKAVVAKY